MHRNHRAVAIRTCSYQNKWLAVIPSVIFFFDGVRGWDSRVVQQLSNTRIEVDREGEGSSRRKAHYSPRSINLSALHPAPAVLRHVIREVAFQLVHAVCVWVSFAFLHLSTIP